MKQEYEFTVILGSDATPDSPGLEDRLYEAGCDDALVCAYGSTVYLQFDREASTAMQAIKSAQANIRTAGFSVHSIQEGRCASISEMAARAGLTRATLDNYLKGKREGDDFPRPVAGLGTKSPLFDWWEAAKWLYEHDKIGKTVLEVAEAAYKFQMSKPPGTVVTKRLSAGVKKPGMKKKPRLAKKLRDKPRRTSQGAA